MATARLFVALDLPQAAVEALLAWRAPLLRGGEQASGPAVLRAVAPAALHVTLCFLGATPETEIAPLGAAVAACAAEAAGAPELALGAALWLPRRRPRVLAVALEDRRGELAALQAGLAAQLAAGGWYDAQARPFLPHVTVARVRGGARAARDPAPPPPEPLVFDAAAVTLYRSRLHPDGARYEPLSVSRLA